MSKYFLKGIKGNCFSLLDSHGFFQEQVNIDLNNNYMPFLLDKVMVKLGKKEKSRDISKVYAAEVKNKTLTQHK